MKKYFILLLLISSFQVFAQTNIAVPSYSSVTTNYNASSGNIKFYLNGVSETLVVGRGANGVCFYGSDMFVAIDDNIGTKGIIWYANVSFASGSFTSDAPIILANNQGTFSVAADASGNIYSANNNGTVTKFIRNNIAPFYSAANFVNTIFWNTFQFADASGVFVDQSTETLWVVSYANNQGAVVKLSDFAFTDFFGNNSKIKRFGDNISLLQKPEGIAKDASGNIWIANNNNNYVLRLNNSVVTSFINDLNTEDYSFITLTASQLNDFEVVDNGHQLGGMVYDNLYSSLMYVSEQLIGGNTFIYSFPANNTTPAFSATAMSQIYPGAGQCAIIPCALLATPANPTASGTSISSGQTANLSASNCAADQTYLWKDNGVSVGTNASFTTPNLSTTTIYTAHCLRGSTCESSGINVTVTVGDCSPGDLSVASTVPSTISDCGITEVIYLKTGQTATLTVSGCLGTLSWSDAHGASGSDASIPITAPSLMNQLGANYINIQCSSGPLCNSFALVTILNQFATDDFYTTPLNTPIEGNVVTNDIETSVALGAYMVVSPANGTISWTMSSGRPTGAFVYTPNTGYVGKDTITYYDSDDLTCSKRANLIITVANPCYNFLALSGSQMTNLGQNKVFQVSESIVTQPYPKIILNSGNSDHVTFQAGKFVELNPGFEVNSGAFFTVKIGPCANAPQTFYTQGKDIYAPNGQKMILKGVNYPVLDDWGFPASDLITEIEKSGANAVRLSWYINYPNRPAYTLTDLDNLLTKCKNNKMVPILDIHDFTCGSDISVLSTAVAWWTSPAVVAILNKHKQYLIINLANELGFYRWAGDYSPSALANWKNAYLSAITAVRAANLLMPIMIDGTDCGSDMKAFHQVGPELISHDPEHNIIFSAHAYWQYYPDQVADLNAVTAANIPLYFGEIANYQSEGASNACDYNLGDNDGYRYQDLLTYCQTNQIGWAAWTWVRDNCSLRNMTSNNPNAPYGGYNTLTPYGQDIVNNATYGIKNTAVRATIFP